MLGPAVLVLVLCLGGGLAQAPTPCLVPMQFTGRMSQYDHLNDQINRYLITYDAVNRRSVIFEEQNIVFPGKQFREFMFLDQENVMYEINLKTKNCTKTAMKRPWRPFGIPNNATFETEYTIGGPAESVLVYEWSDRIPLRQREYWIGSFTARDCYPVHEVLIADYQELNSTITSRFYDIVLGIVDPNVFIPPPECLQARWASPSGLAPFL